MSPLSLPSWLGSSWLGSSGLGRPGLSLLVSRGATKRPPPQTALSRNASIEGAVDEVCKTSTGGLGRPRPGVLCLQFMPATCRACCRCCAPKSMHALDRLRRWWCGSASDAKGLPMKWKQQPALSVILLRSAGRRAAAVRARHQSPAGSRRRQPGLVNWVGADPASRARCCCSSIPPCESINDLISGIDYGFPGVDKIGGIAGHHSSNHGSLLINDRSLRGAVGCLIGGGWRLTRGAQGCRRSARSLKSRRPSATLFCNSVQTGTQHAR